MAMELFRVSLLGSLISSTAASASSGAPAFLVVPGANGFLIDMYTGGMDYYQFPAAGGYRENRGHVGTWMTRAPDAMFALGGRKVLPKFFFNETLAKEQEAFEASNPPNGSAALEISKDYGFYNKQSKPRRMEMVFDALMRTTGPALVFGTSEGGAILLKLLESDELAAHVLEQGMRRSDLSGVRGRRQEYPR